MIYKYLSIIGYHQFDILLLFTTRYLARRPMSMPKWRLRNKQDHNDNIRKGDPDVVFHDDKGWR